MPADIPASQEGSREGAGKLATPSEKRRRKVSFDEGINRVSECNLEHGDFVLEDIWFTSAEYARIKNESKVESKEWRKLGYGILLKETFEAPRRDANARIMAFCQLEGEQLSRRGLERQLSRQHGDERAEMKDRARQSVVIHQLRLRRLGLSSSERSSELAVIYREVTKPARVFARRFGRADEQVALHGETNIPATNILLADKQRQSQRKTSLHNDVAALPPLERRPSNFSVKSSNSFDSRRNGSWSRSSIAGRRGHVLATASGKHCPQSPASPMEEYYAAIA